MIGRAMAAGGAVLLALSLAACPPAPGPFAGPAAGADTARTVLEGVVAVAAGPAGRGIPTLQPEGARAVALLGALAGELAEVDGARVRATGRRSFGPAPGGGFEVSGYEILAVDGERPVVGVVRASGGGTVLVLAGGATVRLVGAPPELSARAGAKAWVVGRPAAGGIAVQRYGFLRLP